LNDGEARHHLADDGGEAGDLGVGHDITVAGSGPTDCEGGHT
jgi:hypothetical protein